MKVFVTFPNKQYICQNSLAEFIQSIKTIKSNLKWNKIEHTGNITKQKMAKMMLFLILPTGGV